MATFVGFNTQNADTVATNGYATGITNTVSTTPQPANTGTKFKMTDEDLVIQDFINAMNIQQGTKPGNPGYGTTLWSFIFEPNSVDTRYEIETEIQRIASLDPRLILNTITIDDQDTGLLVTVELAVSPFNNPTTLALFFDQASGKATSV
jgi:phage baseplate assembly protein W